MHGLLLLLIALFAPTESPPFCAIEMAGPVELVTVDGSTWALVPDEVVAAEAADASSTAEVEAGWSTFLVVGAVPAGVEAGVAALLAVVPEPRAMSAPSVSTETHPTQPHDDYKVKKTIKTSGGADKEIYKTIVVEKRAGETGPEFQKRSERELRDAIDAGWESVP